MKKFIILAIIISALINTMLYSQNIFVVTKTGDPDPFDHPYNYNDALCDTAMYGTLQWAIRKTNDSPAPSEIQFNIPGTGQHIINLNFTLPPVNKQVSIDGSTQSGYNYNNGPSIIIDGTNIPIYNHCFNFSAYDDSSSVKAIHIRNFWASSGIMAVTGHITIKDCMFWNVGGEVYPWRNIGVYIAAPYAIVQGNVFGTDITATQNHGCAAEAIYLQSQYLPADNCLIGGSGLNEGNLIVNSGWNGITVVNGKHNKISRNRMYDNAGGINLLIYAGSDWWGNEGKPAPIIDTLSPTGVLSGTSQANDVIEIFGSTAAQNANEYITTVTANGSGNWSATINNFNWQYLIATATDADNNTSELSNVYEIIIPPPMAVCATATEIIIDTVCIPQNYTVQTNDLWFKFTTDTANIDIRVSYPVTSAASIDKMSAYEGICDSLILYAQINNDTLSLYDLIPGNTYYLKLHAALTGNFKICAQKAEPIFIPPDYAYEQPASNGAYYENRGQIIDTYENLRPDIKYYNKSTSPEIYLTDTAISFVLAHIDTIAATPDTMQRVDMKLGGNSHLSRPYKREQAIGYLNYYLGHCPQGITNVQGYNRVVYPDAYPGVTLQCYSNTMGAKFYFTVKPGAKTSNIILKFNGADSLYIDNSGKLIIKTSLGNIEYEHAKCYKVNPAGNVVPMPSQGDYVQLSSTEIGFNLQQPPGNTMPVVIMMEKGSSVQHPTQNGNLDWSTYYGGSKEDYFYDIKTDTYGKIYITGYALSTNFPRSDSAIYTTNAGANDVVVLKFDSTCHRGWATYYGGLQNDMGYGIAVDTSNYVYVTGSTGSSNFPLDTLSGAFMQYTYNGGDAFIIKLNPGGKRDSLTWTTYFGSGGSQEGKDIKLDEFQNIYIVGNSTTGYFAKNQIGSYNNSINGKGLISKFNSQDSLVWAAIYAGSEKITSIAIDTANSIFITGSTKNNSLPLLKPDANSYIDSTLTGTSDEFIAKLNSSDTIIWSTYYGGSGTDIANAICTDKEGNIYLTGNTHSSDFWIADPENFATMDWDNSGHDNIFIQKFGGRDVGDVGVLIWSTYYGLNGTFEYGYDIVVDDTGNIFVTGSIATASLPIKGLPGAYNDGTFNSSSGGSEAIILGFKPNLHCVWSIYFGGDGHEAGWGLATYKNSRLFLVGSSSSKSSDFPLQDPTTSPIEWMQWSNAWQGAGFIEDGFISRFYNYPVMLASGIEDNLMNIYYDINVYPNPSSDNITIVLDAGFHKQLAIAIYSIMGQKVYSENVNDAFGLYSKYVNISNLKSGLYIVQVLIEGKSFSKKIIKQY